MNAVTESDIDLQWNPCPRQVRRQADAGPLVFVDFANGPDLQRSPVEHNAITWKSYLADASESFAQRLGMRITLAQQIKIARRPEDMLRPCHEQHRAFEHIAFGLLGLAKAEQQALNGVTGQHPLKILPVPFGVGEQLGANRDSGILGKLVVHCMAKM
ncbi:hypothetical protein D3C72_1509590 [compost metagenome]